MKTRRPTAELLPIAQEIARILKDACVQLSIAGSIRRNKATAGDIEIVAVPKITNSENELWALLDDMLANGDVTKALYGAKQRTKWGEKSRGLMFQDTQVEIYTSYPHSWGYQYWLRTGPSEANEYVMKMQYEKHAKFRLKDGEVLTSHGVLNIPTEEDWFKLLGIPYTPAKDRSVELYHHYFEAKDHNWGNLLQFLGDKTESPAEEKPEQKSLIPVNVDNFTSSHHHWEYESPWLIDDHDHLVWVNVFTRWLILPRESGKARAYQKLLHKFPSIREAHRSELAERLTPPHWDVHGTSAMLTNLLDGELVAGVRGDKWHGSPSLEMIPIDLIVPLDDMVLMRHVRRYWEQYKTKGHMRDKDGYLPVVLRFADDPFKVYLSNGHHRYYVARHLFNLSHLECLVDDVPMPAAEGIHWYDDEFVRLASDDEDMLANVLTDLVDALEIEYV
jgi:hypothetical protein